MANEIIPGSGRLPSVPTPTVTASENATAIGQVFGDIKIELSQEDLVRMLGAKNESHAADWVLLNTDRFNVFVVESEKYDCGSFSIAKRTALRKYTDKEHAEYFSNLSPDVIEELKNMPCIFAARNQGFKTARINYPAFVGKLTEVTCQGEIIKFRFVVCGKLKQQFINDNINLFNLLTTTVRNQLDEEHWSIRTGNLLEIADRVGIEIN